MWALAWLSELTLDIQSQRTGGLTMEDTGLRVAESAQTMVFGVSVMSYLSMLRLAAGLGIEDIGSSNPRSGSKNK